MEDKILVSVQEAIQGINKTIQVVSSLKNQVDKLGQSNGFKNINKQIKGTNTTLKETLGLGAAFITGKQALKTLKDMTAESINFIETTNLFNVSLGKGVQGLNEYYEKAVKFQNELTEKLGVNLEESMKYQAIFNQMSKSMGIAADTSYLLSENFTKLGYDISSLYNIDTQEAMRKLRAGLAGETEPLRAIGLDITEQSLQPVLDRLGIQESLRNMSQAEKIILRYIALIQQASAAHGDFANTINQPAQQLKIFNAQITAFKRNVGNLWQGMFGSILPYINAIMMVINELLKMLASLFNIKFETAPVNVGVDSLGDSLDNATDSAKKLKKQLMGFDEIHNITVNTGTGATANVGGIDQRLLDAMKEYDNLMSNVKSKATEIRDKIMEWLGFTKEINPETGEITWRLQEGYTNIQKIKDIAIGIGTAILGWKLGSFIEDIVKAITKVGSLKKLIGSISKNWKIKLSVTLVAAEIGWNIGTSIGDWIKENYGDSITWYINKFNLDINKDSLVEQIVKIGGIMLATIGDVIVDLTKKAWNWLKEEWTKGLNNFTTIFSVLAQDSTLWIINGVLEVIKAFVPDVGKKGIEFLQDVIKTKHKDLDETIKSVTIGAFNDNTETIKQEGTKLGVVGANSIGTGIESRREIIKNATERTGINAINSSKSSLAREATAIGREIPTGVSIGITNNIRGLTKTNLDMVRGIEREVKTIDTREAGKYTVEGVAKGINSNKNNWTLWDSLRGLKNTILNGINGLLGIHSPSTVMRDMVGKFIPLGIAEGIDRNATAVFSSIKDLNNGINNSFSVNPNDFKIDTNQFIDYGQISGAIATQSNVNVSSDIEARIENAIYRGLSNATIPVEIEATTDEGIIFKKVQTKAKEFRMQTGEPAFGY